MARRGRRPKTDAERRFDVELGQRLCQVRRDAGFSAGEFARRSAVSRQLLYRYETGECAVPLRTWVIFARVLHVSLVSLVKTSTFSLQTENWCAGCTRNR
jgi:predicted transcriptional regulator